MSEKKKPKLVMCCEVYSRTVGYLRPTSHWNTAKRLEFEDRKVYAVNKAIKSIEKGVTNGNKAGNKGVHSL